MSSSTVVSFTSPPAVSFCFSYSIFCKVVAKLNTLAYLLGDGCPLPVALFNGSFNDAAKSASVFCFSSSCNPLAILRSKLSLFLIVVSFSAIRT